MINALIDFVRTHPLAAATAWLGIGILLDVLAGVLDGWIRGEFSLDKLPQVLKTKLLKNPYAQAILGLYAAAFVASGQDLKGLLIATTVTATLLYSAPVWRDVVQKVGFIVEDLYAKVKAAPFPARA